MVVLGLMVWIVKRVRTSISNGSTSPDQSSCGLPATALESANLDLVNHQSHGTTIQMLQQPLMMTVMEPGEFKQALELDHYVIA